MTNDPHPLQPIRDGIAAVYKKAVADGDDTLHVLSLAILVELDRLRRKAGLSPIGKGDR
jgi:hypothetical protein